MIYIIVVIVLLIVNVASLMGIVFPAQNYNVVPDIISSIRIKEFVKNLTPTANSSKTHLLARPASKTDRMSIYFAPANLGSGNYSPPHHAIPVVTIVPPARKMKVIVLNVLEIAQPHLIVFVYMDIINFIPILRTV